ncbi:MAG: cytochrome c3 family protein [Caldimicrobium thiodismutans]
MRKVKILIGTLILLLSFTGIAFVSEKNKGESVKPEEPQGVIYYESEQFGGPEIVYVKPVRGVLFSHKKHVGELGFPCESCHNSLFEMQALKSQENPDFKMEALYQGKYCGACHNGQAAFASNTKCATCHIGVKGLKEYMRKLASKEKK